MQLSLYIKYRSKETIKTNLLVTFQNVFQNDNYTVSCFFLNTDLSDITQQLNFLFLSIEY